MSTYATHDKVAEELGLPAFTDPARIAQIERWLARAESLIRGRISDLGARVAVDPIYLETVVDVEVLAVARKARNPDGKVSESVDDYNYRLNENERKGAVFIEASEWERLLPPESEGAFSIRRSGHGPDRFYNDPWPLRRVQ